MVGQAPVVTGSGSGTGAFLAGSGRSAVPLFDTRMGGWAWAGFVLSVIWLITAAVDRWMFHTEWVCSRCGAAFTPDVETETY